MLLRAALLEGERARAAFERWRRRVDPMALARGSFELLPRLARSLLRAGVDDPCLELWKGTYRRAFASNEILFRDVQVVWRVLASAAVPTLVIGGAAIVAGAGDDSGLRPVTAVRVLVPPAHAWRAFDALEALGWRSGAAFEARLPRSGRGAAFTGPGDRTIDVGWYLLAENSYPGADDALWQGGRHGRLGPAVVRMPCAADQLLHACVEGLQRSTAPRVAWAADAFVLCASGEVDWGRLASEAARRRVALPVRIALHWIRERLDAPVSDSALARLDALPVTGSERRELDAKLAPAGAMARLQVLWSYHARAAAAADLGRASTLARFLPYVQERWGVEHVWQLPAFVLRRGLRRFQGHVGPGARPPSARPEAPEPRLEARNVE